MPPLKAHRFRRPMWYNRLDLLGPLLGAGSLNCVGEILRTPVTRVGVLAVQDTVCFWTIRPGILHY
jgi:hypothetical protein